MAEAAQNWSDDIKAIGDQIVGLSLLQAKELSDYLKEEHGLEAAAGGAVMMAQLMILMIQRMNCVL